MTEAIRNLTLLLWAACMVNSPAKAQENWDTETIVEGAAATADGQENLFVVEQPTTAPNPLGDPLPVKEEIVQPQTVEPQEVVQTPGNGAAPMANPDLGKDFQNTLLEANGRVYDVQSYPEADLPAISNPANPKTIYSPNVNP